MNSTITITALTGALALHLCCLGMEKATDAVVSGSKSPELIRKDVAIPILPKEERERLAEDFEKHSSSENPELLRRAFFGTVSAIAHTPLDKRDTTVEADAQKVRTLICKHYPSEEIRENSFLYGMGQVLNKPAQDDRHPHRELYTPVEYIRATLKENTEKQSGLQKTSEELAKEENALEQQIAELSKKRAETQKRKALQLAELLMIAQANNTLKAQRACLIVQLQERRDSLIDSVENAITEFVTLKKELTQAHLAHEKDNLSQRANESEAKITTNLDSLWFCMHYLQRMDSPDGSIGAWDETKWKLGVKDFSSLGINNYQQYLDAKNK